MTTHVKVTKLTRLPDRPDGVVISWEQSDLAITEGYWVRGWANDAPKVGTRFVVDRYERSGVQMRGEFVTTAVEEVTEIEGGWTIRTANSIYRVERLP